MKKHLKKITAIMLAFLTMVSLLTAAIPSNNIGVNTYAASPNGTDSYAGMSNQDLTMKSTSSFGNLLTGALDSELEEQQENESVILSVEVEDKTAAVEFQTLINATIIVGIYDESGEQLIASGVKDVTAEETESDVAIETAAMPQYFYVKAFMIEKETMRPICAVYESPMYTQEMQELLAMETTDFDADRVLNLDEQTETNFAVYSEETIVIPQSENNDVTYADDALGVYVIENADSSITSLETGDVFAYEYEDGSVIIVKVASITMDGTTATITGEETSLEEVFDYVKVEAEANTTDAIVDNSNLEEGVVFNGIVDEEQNNRMKAVDITDTITKSLEYEFLDIKIGSDDDDESIIQASVTLSGKVKLKFENSLNVYVSLSSQYVELKLDYSLKAEISLTGKAGVKIPFGYIRFDFPGGHLAFTPSFVAEVSGEISITAGVSGTLGLKVTNKGIENLTTSPKLEAEFKAELTIFIGLSLKPKLVIITEKAVDLSITAEFGVKAVAESKKSVSTDTSERHECRECIDGEVYFKAELEFKAKLLNLKKLTFKKSFTREIKICDFYWSFDFEEFKFTECPHYAYKTTIIVQDYNGKPIKNVAVTVDDGYANGTKYTATTDSKGKVQMYLRSDNYTARFTANNKTVFRDFTIDDKPLKLTINVSSNRLSLGGQYSGYITDDGSLYMWGQNYDGGLGDGTTTHRYTPVKIMNNVSSVSLGNTTSAAITTDGSLYMWGDNLYGQLGDGTTIERHKPVKIMNNVSQVSLSWYHSAVITTDGSLYMWGDNQYGKLGDGTTTHRIKPVKIMDNVSAVSLGREYSAAITTDGSLYTWGCNDNGQLGDGSTTERHKPVKILDNVSTVSLGDFSSAAITTNGSLYMWGYNGYGHLGDGTTTDRHKPVKIMNGISYVSLGDSHSAAITTNGTLYMWGDNWYGQLGNGTTTDRYKPLKIMNNVSFVSLGYGHSGAMKTNGSLYMWGMNQHGELGDGTTIERHNPTKITIPSAGRQSVSSNNTAVSENVLTTAEGAAAFTGLYANEVYNFYAMMDKDFPEPFANDNLLYISQGITDENGELSFNYTPKADDTDAEKFVVRMKRFDLSAAEISLTDLKYTGEEQFVAPIVTLDGEILVEGVDYELCDDYSATNCGKYTVTVRGKGIYKGYNSVDYYVFVDELTVNPTSFDLHIGESVQISCAAPDGREITFVSDNTAVATVSENGMITAIDNGSCSITVSDGYSSIVCTVTVTTPATAIGLDKTELSLQLGSSNTLSAILIPENTTDIVTWNSSDESIATVDENGTVTAIALGSCTITATAGEASAICTVTVIDPFAKPTNLYAYTFGYTSIRMTWDAVEGAEGYEIFRCDRAGQPYNYVDTVSADAGETAYRNIGLSTGTTYYYKVRAYKTLEDGTKLYSDLSAYSSARPLPAMPVVTAVRTSATTAKISWVKIYGATGYSVYYSTEENGTYKFLANLKSGDTTTYKATGLASAKTYYYKVRAYRQMGDDMMFGSYSKPAAAFGAPAVPTITARGVGYTSAKVLWEPVKGADGYAIYRCDVGGGAYSYITSVGADVTTYTNTGLSTGTTYYYKVRAFVNTDSGKLYSNYSACATARPLPATPVVTVTADDANNATISWVRIYGATGYSVYRSTEKDGTYSFLAGISSGDTVSYTDKNTDEGVTYYYKVRAYRQMGKDMMFGEYSKPAYVK